MSRKMKETSLWLMLLVGAVSCGSGKQQPGGGMDEGGGGAGAQEPGTGATDALGGESNGSGGKPAGSGGKNSATGGKDSATGGKDSATGGKGGGTGGKSAGTGGEASGSGGDGGSSASGGSPGSSQLGCSLAWSSGFENGFPGGEWQPWQSGWSPDGTLPEGSPYAWTIIDRSGGEPVFSGDHGYKGWIVGTGTENHRAYPVLHTNIQTPLVNTFMVYLDVDYEALGSEWIHFGTWGNEEGDTGSWALHTMSVRYKKLEFAHTSPNSGEYIGPEPEPEFPVGKWVRFTMYLEYAGSTGFVQAWQDGVPVLRGEVTDLEQDPGTRLTRAHWGMYASPGTASAVQYNDDIAIWTLKTPLTDLVTEPDCYLGN